MGEARLDLISPTRVHVVGIGGAGMSAIAAVLIAMGHEVTGSDLKPSRAVDRLSALGARIAIGHDAANLADAEVLAVSTAIGARNPEVVAAADAEVPVCSRAEVLTAITALKRTVSVAGTHGKTTTASMLAVALTAAELSPSFIIGGDVHEIGSGAVWSDGDWFVVEADESDGTMTELDTQVGLITNIEADHLGHYGSEEALQSAFASFAAGATEAVIGCADDPGAQALARAHGGSTYGHDADADLRLVDLVTGRAGSSFGVEVAGTRLGVDLPMPGAHNALNAVGAVAGAAALGADLGRVAEALGEFGGVARRFELRGERDGVVFVDDYAHLPTEVRAALTAATAGGWGRIVCVFQPHRYTRIGDLWSDYGDAFSEADVVYITDIYSAGEEPIPGVTGHLIVDAVRAADPTADVRWAPDRDVLVADLADGLRAGDLCLTLGAGDLTTLPDDLLGAGS